MKKLMIYIVVISLAVLSSCGELALNPSVTDSQAPTLPTSYYQVEVQFFASESAYKCLWGAAMDDVTFLADIQYMVYESSSPDISTMEDCKSNGTAISGWITGQTYEITPSVGAHYYNVIARDEAENETIYTMSENFNVVG